MEKELTEKLKKVLNEINPRIMNYEGENMIKDHIVDSFDVVEIASGIADEFGIEIDPELIVWNRFITVSEIEKFVEELLDK